MGVVLPVNVLLLMGTQNVTYSRRVLEYSLRYSPSTRVANYSDSTALLQSHLTNNGVIYSMLFEVVFKGCVYVVSWNKSFAPVNTATISSKMAIAAANWVCGESIRVSRVSRVRVRFSNVLRVGVEG